MWRNYVFDNFDNEFLKASTSKTGPLSSIPCVSLKGHVRVSIFDILLIESASARPTVSFPRIYSMWTHKYWCGSIIPNTPTWPYRRIFLNHKYWCTDIHTYLQTYNLLFPVKYIYIALTTIYLSYLLVMFQTICNIFTNVFLNPRRNNVFHIHSSSVIPEWYIGMNIFDIVY